MSDLGMGTSGYEQESRASSLDGVTQAAARIFDPARVRIDTV
jgi:hypothetical protein